MNEHQPRIRGPNNISNFFRVNATGNANMTGMTTNPAGSQPDG